MKKLLLSSLLILALVIPVYAQEIKPGFEKSEYLELLKINTLGYESVLKFDIPKPQHYHRVYRSEATTLDNLWELWMDKDKQSLVISIRGTTAAKQSWFENMYAVMVPATGNLTFEHQAPFHYDLATRKEATVHLGWLIGMAQIAQDMTPILQQDAYKNFKNIYIVGHSQGGAISYLLTMYIKQLQKENKLPTDIKLKTYCSAAPKPGNYYFAQDYGLATQSGLGFNIVNTADWVPEVPFSIQTIHDFNPINALGLLKGQIKQQSFFKRLAMNYMYRKLTIHPIKAQANFEKTLGGLMGKMTRPYLPNLKTEKPVKNNQFTMAGQTIFLKGNNTKKMDEKDMKMIMVNHDYSEYYKLALSQL